jgi:signal transduction histidine kinase
MFFPNDYTIYLLSVIVILVVICLLLFLKYRKIGKKVNLLQKDNDSLINNSQNIASLSHEVKNMINGISGMTSLLSLTQLDNEQKEYLNILKTYSENLKGLLDDVLLFSRLECGKLELDSHCFNVTQLVGQVLHAYDFEIRKKELTLELKLDKSMDNLYVYGDSLRLSQVLNNLIGNAVKFTAKGFITVNMSLLDTGENRCTILFDIVDTGVGIAEEQKQDLFKFFKQASTNVARKYGGSGLGLAISKTLVEMMGGTLEFQSCLGKGSRFYFSIPMNKCTNLEDIKLFQKQIM